MPESYGGWACLKYHSKLKKIHDKSTFILVYVQMLFSNEESEVLTGPDPTHLEAIRRSLVVLGSGRDQVQAYEQRHHLEFATAFASCDKAPVFAGMIHCESFHL